MENSQRLKPQIVVSTLCDMNQGFMANAKTAFFIISRLIRQNMSNLQDNFAAFGYGDWAFMHIQDMTDTMACTMPEPAFLPKAVRQIASS